MEGKYSKLELPDLYLIAEERNIKFFGKNKKEMNVILEQYDVEHVGEPEEKQSKPVKENNKTMALKKNVELEEDDDVIDIDDEDETPATKKKAKRADVEPEEEEEEAEEVEEEEEEVKPAPKKKAKVVEPEEEEEEAEEVEEEEAEEEKPAPKKKAKVVEPEEEEEEAEDEKPAPKKKVKAPEPETDEYDDMDRKELITFIKENKLKIALLKAKSEDDYRDEIRKTFVKKSVEKKSQSGKVGVKRIEKDPEKTSAPFQEGTAGYFCFIAATKGGSLTMIGERADKLIEKAGAKPPANTIQKVKIIMQEINNGKRGKEWGHFNIGDNGKVTYEA